jgi:hypothetical protein
VDGLVTLVDFAFFSLPFAKTMMGVGWAVAGSMRRFTRLTNAFSKKVENHAAAVVFYFMWYNFGRVHQTLRVTPAMEAGVAKHVWSVEEIVGLLDTQK